MDVGALDEDETGPAKWAAQQGNLSSSESLRRFSTEMLKGRDGFKVDPSIPSAKSNSVTPAVTHTHHTLPGAIVVEDVEDMMT
jgi:hypothetical protein